MVYNINKIFLGKYFKIKNMKTKKRKALPVKGRFKLKTTEALTIVVTVLFLEAIILGVNFYLSHTSQNSHGQLSSIAGIKIAEAAPANIDVYAIEEITNSSCRQDVDCQVPGEYLIQSRCQFASKCLGSYCAIVCPGLNNLTWNEALKIINNGDQRPIMLRPHQL